MSEAWAPDPLTPEEQAEYQKELDSVTEDEPLQVPVTGVDPDDPPQIDRRTASERLMGDVEAKPEEPEAETPEDAKAVPEPQKVEAAEERPEPKDEFPVDDSWPEDVKQTVRTANESYRGLKGETYRLREKNRRYDQTVQDLRQQIESIPQMIEEAIKKATAAPPPDPELDPEGYIQHTQVELQTMREKQAQEEKQRTEQTQQEREFNDLNQYVIDQESEYLEQAPDYWQAKQHAIEAGIQSLKREYGLDDQIARQQVAEFMAKEAATVRQLGGNVAHRFYHLAKNTYGWNGAEAPAPAPVQSNGAVKTQSVGERDADTIARGQAASKGLGKSGSAGSVGKMTLEEISKIKDPEEHKKAYERWAAEQTGESTEWR